MANFLTRITRFFCQALLPGARERSKRRERVEPARLMSVELEERRVFTANPTFTSPSSETIAENTDTVQTVTTDDADDPPQVVTVAITGGDDETLFELDGDVLKFKTAPDFESPGDLDTDNVYEVELTATDETMLTAVQTVTVTVTDVNEAPTFDDVNPSHDENTSTVSLSVSDEDLPAQTITLSLTGNGDDEALFEISGNQLQFLAAPDHENPGDTGADNNYEVEVQANDGNGGVTTQMITVTVNDVNEAPVFTDTTPSISENTQTVTLPITDEDVPAQTITLSLTGNGDDEALFEISGNQLQFIAAPDFENPGDTGADNDYEVEVQANDGNGGVTTQMITVTVNNANDDPVFASTTPSIDENTTSVALSITDEDLPAQTITLTLTGSGDDEALFEISGNQLQFIAAPDHENPGDTGADNEYEVEVQADDGNGGVTSQMITVTVNDVNEAPVFTNTTPSIVENNAIVSLAIADEDVPAQSITLSLTGNGADEALFEISGNQLQFIAAPDFESPGDSDMDNDYIVEVQANDGNGGISTEFITVTVTEGNDPPVFNDTTPSIVENTTLVALSISDADVPAQTITLSLTGSGDDAGLFTIIGNQLHFSSAPNFESPGDTGGNNTYEVEVEADDGVDATTAVVTVTVTDTNDAPVFDDTNPSHEENTTTVALSFSDEDLPAQTLTLSLTGGGDDAGLFTIVGNQLQFNTAPDFESPADADFDNDYEVELELDDGNGGVTTELITVSVTDGNDPPVFDNPANIDVDENVSDIVTLSVTDADSDLNTMVYTIVGGADQALFNIRASDDVLEFTSGSGQDFEAPADSDTDNVYEVEIEVDDTDGNVVTQLFLISVQPVNEFDPTLTSSLTPSVVENTTSVQTLTASDADSPTPSFTFSITGSGDDDALFTITGGNQLAFQTAPDFEAPADADLDNQYEVEIEVSDGTRTSTTTVTVSVTGVNDEDPVFSSSTTPSVAENTTFVQTLLATDQDDPPTAVSYSIIGGDDSAAFTLVGDQLQFAAAPDFEAPADADLDNVYEVEVQADDGNGGIVSQTVSVTVTPVNDNAPIFNSATAVTVTEPDQFVQTVSATDADLPSQTLIYSITGAGADDALFEIVSGDQLQFSAAPDFENPLDSDVDNIYLVEVQASDQAGEVTTQIVTVTVTDSNDTPVFTSAAAVNVNENVTSVTTLTASDADLPAQTLTFSIVGGADQSLFTLSGGNQLQFIAAPDFENPLDSDVDNVYEVTVRVTDSVGAFSEQSMQVTVDPVNDNLPSFQSAATVTIDENVSLAQTLVATDDDLPAETISYSIVGGVDMALFTIASGNELRFLSVPDFETPLDFDGDNTYEVTVQASDNNGGVTQQAVTVNVNGIDDEDPVFSSGTLENIFENSIIVQDVIAVDGDTPQRAITLSLEAGVNDNDLFTLVGTQLQFIVAPDFEIPLDIGADNTYLVTIRADDGAGGVTDQNVTVIVAGLNDNSPVFVSDATVDVAENTTAVQTLIATDADLPAQTVTFSIVGGADQASFQLSGVNNAQLDFISAQDYELFSDANGDNTFEVTLRATDTEGAFTDQSVQIQLTDAVEDIVYNATTDLVSLELIGGQLHLQDAGDTDLIAPHVFTNVGSVSLIGALGVDTTFDINTVSIPTDGIQITGNGATDTIEGPDGQANEWVVTAVGVGTLNTDIDFTGIESLSGSGIDVLNANVGAMTTVRHQGSGAGAGEIDFDFDLGTNTGTVDLTYSGMDAVNFDPASITNLVLDLPTGASTSTIEESGTDQAVLTTNSPTDYALLTFLMPTDMLVIRGGSGNDQVTIQTPDADTLAFGGDILVQNALGTNDLNLQVAGTGTLQIGGSFDFSGATLELFAGVSANDVEIVADKVVDAVGITALTVGNQLTIETQNDIGESTNWLTVNADAIQLQTLDTSANSAPIYLEVTGAASPTVDASTENSDIQIASVNDLVANIITGGGNISLLATNLDIADQVKATEAISIFADDLNISSGGLAPLTAESLGIISTSAIGALGSGIPTDVDIFAAQTTSTTVSVSNQGTFELGSVDVLTDTAGTVVTIFGIQAGSNYATSVTPQLNSNPKPGTSTAVTEGLVEIEVTLANALANGYTFQMEWPGTDDPSNFPFNQVPDDVDTQLTAGVTETFSVTYIENPNDDPADLDVEVPFVVLAPDGIELVDSTDPDNPVDLGRLESSFTFTLLSLGIPFQLQPQEEDAPAVAPEPLVQTPPPATIPPPSPATPPTPFASAANNQSADEVRMFVLRIVVQEEEGTTREIDVMQFRAAVRLNELFADLPNDHYRLYLVTGDSEQMIKDFVLEGGAERDQEVIAEDGDAAAAGSAGGANGESQGTTTTSADGDDDGNRVNGSGDSPNSGQLPALTGATTAALIHAGSSTTIDRMLAADGGRRLGKLSRLLRRARNKGRINGRAGDNSHPKQQ